VKRLTVQIAIQLVHLIKKIDYRKNLIMLKNEQKIKLKRLKNIMLFNV